MATFRFRAAAALDLRHRQERDAAAVVARAEAAVQRARDDRQAADVARSDAQQTLAAAQAHGIDGSSLEWHRNWISRLGAAVTRQDAEIQRRLVVMREAEQAWREARRKRLALERLRERTWRRFQAEEARRERQVIDELARLRFTLRDDQDAAGDGASHEEDA